MVCSFKDEYSYVRPVTCQPSISPVTTKAVAVDSRGQSALFAVCKQSVVTCDAGELAGCLPIESPRFRWVSDPGETAGSFGYRKLYTTRTHIPMHVTWNYKGHKH
jgi:hypothetical protein